MMDFLQAVSTVGFPIAITCYMLIRHEKTLNELTSAITNLRVMLEIHMKDTH